MDANRLTAYFLAAAAAVAIARVVALGLARRFPLLLGWLIMFGVVSMVGIVFYQGSRAYFWAYLIVQPLFWLAGVAAAGELFALAFTAYPGIRAVGRWGIYFGIALATGAVVAITRFFHRTSTHGSIHLFYLETTDRAIVLSVAIVILTLRIFISRFPIDLGRNTSISSTFFCIVFLSEAARLLIDSMTSQLLNSYVDWTQDGLTAVATVVWSLMLRRADEPVRPLQPPRSAHEDELIAQLKSVNELLSRLGRGGRPPAARVQLR